MSLAKKYGDLWKKDPELAAKTMVKDGVISCTWAGKEAVYLCFQKNRGAAKSKTDAVHQTAVDMNCSVTHVWESIQPFER